MEHAELLYSGLMFAAGMLSLWTAVLLTAAFVVLAPRLRKSATVAATISSTRSLAERFADRSFADRFFVDHSFADRRSEDFRSQQHGAEEATPACSLSQTISDRPDLGINVRPADQRNCSPVSAGIAARHQRSSFRRHQPETAQVRSGDHRRLCRQGHLPVPHAMDRH